MPALFIDSCSQLKSILEKSEFLSPHNWLISNLECYDTTGWEGCEKWKKQSLILTDEELKNDIYLRDMQFIWVSFLLYQRTIADRILRNILSLNLKTLIIWQTILIRNTL